MHQVQQMLTARRHHMVSSLRCHAGIGWRSAASHSTGNSVLGSDAVADGNLHGQPLCASGGVGRRLHAPDELVCANKACLHEEEDEPKVIVFSPQRNLIVVIGVYIYILYISNIYTSIYILR